jgi:hypothetical protein
MCYDPFMPIQTIHSTCEYCGIGFDQPDDPGRKRRFHSNACRQADYRRRRDARQAQDRAREADDWFRTWSRIRRESSKQAPGPRSKAQRIRIQVDALRAKASSTTFPGEARLCHEKADELAAKYL